MEYWVLDITLADIEMKNKHRESIKKSGKKTKQLERIFAHVKASI